jgi:hypothetical protein
MLHHAPTSSSPSSSSPSSTTQPGRNDAPEFAEPHHHQHRKRRRTASHGAEIDDEPTMREKPTPTMVPSVLKLLIDELQDMRRSVKSMKKDVSKLSSKQVSFGGMQHGTNVRV